MNEGTGYVIWPTDCRDTGEGGLWVYAVVLADRVVDFVACHGPDTTVALPLPDVVLSDDDQVYPPEEKNWWHRPEPENLTDPAALKDFVMRVEMWVYRRVTHGSSVLAAVCLGSSGGSWWNEDMGEYWRCTPETLTDEGRALLNSLAKLYGAEPSLITYLDT